jgi:hypothetical protein
MSAHDTIGVNLPASFGARFAQGAQEQEPILIGAHHGAALVALVHHLVDGSGGIRVGVFWLRDHATAAPAVVNTKNRPLFKAAVSNWPGAVT